MVALGFDQPGVGDQPMNEGAFVLAAGGLVEGDVLLFQREGALDIEGAGAGVGAFQFGVNLAAAFELAFERREGVFGL